MVTNEQMKIEFSYFGEVWTFFKKYYEVQNNDKFWEKAMEEAAAINQKYHCELCKDLLMAVIDELERRGKAKEHETL